MPKRNAYERRGNNNARTVRDKAEANKPITRREIRAAFEAWQAGRGEGGTSAHRARIAVKTIKKQDGQAVRSKRSTNNALYDSDINTPAK